MIIYNKLKQKFGNNQMLPVIIVYIDNINYFKNDNSTVSTIFL